MQGPHSAPAPAARRERLAILALALLCWLPFLTKPFHIDDPVYLRVAQHILAHPLDPFGFEMNWHGHPEPVWQFNKNPPGLSYYLALVGKALGFGEPVMHAAMLLWNLALVAAVMRLARSFGAPPALAGLALLAMPGVLVSGTTVMTDVPALALLTAAVLLWRRGLEPGGYRSALAGALLAGLAPLFKYVALLALPLLALDAALRGRPGLRRLPLLLIPVAIVLVFDTAMRTRYGISPFTSVGRYALEYRSGGGGAPARAVTVLSFLGGSFLPLLFAAPLLAQRRVLAALLLAAAGAGLAVGLPHLGPFGPLELRTETGIRWSLALQLAAFTLTGFLWLALAARETLQRPHRDALVLGAWLLGVVVFAGLLNWSTNVRALLPAAPAAAILLARALARSPLRLPTVKLPVAPLVLAPGLAVGLLVSCADLRFAEAARRAAWTLVPRYRTEGHTVWFQGAWGFQHYAEAAGARRMNQADALLLPGDVVLLPTNNSGVRPVAPQAVTLLEVARFPVASAAATMSPQLGSGFHTDQWGPLPYALGRPPAEEVYALRVRRPIQIVRRPSDGSLPAPVVGTGHSKVTSVPGRHQPVQAHAQ